MRSNADYTKEELTTLFLDIEKRLGRTPKSNELRSVNLPGMNYYRRAFGSWAEFLQSLGRNVEKKSYRMKTNIKRFFGPSEWNKFVRVIHNEDHKFWFEFLLNTGLRYQEAKSISIKEIDFDRRQIFISNPKGGKRKQRTIQVSSQLTNQILHYMRMKNLGKNDMLGFPSVQFLDKVIKVYARTAGLETPEDFSCHNLRKTFENWLVALDINVMVIQAHIGHTIDVAAAHYVSTVMVKKEEKILIREILGDLFQ